MRIATKPNRSIGTIHSQINANNSGINRSGFCPKCRRMKGDKQTEKV